MAQTVESTQEQGGKPGTSRQEGRTAAPTGKLTVTGCVTREVAGQFALSNAVNAPGAVEATGDAGAARGSTGARSGGDAVGTAGSVGAATGSGGVTYSLAGDRELELEKYVGQRIEIVGTLGAPSTDGPPAGPSGSGDRGDAARAPVTRPEGTTAGGDANRGSVAPSGHAPRLTIVSFRPTGGDCANR